VTQQAQAIFWAQWRTLRNFYPRRGLAWTAIVGVLWYGSWSIAALAFLRVFSNPAELATIRIALPGGLLLMLLYWQVIPLLLAATGSALDLRKLRAYPIPPRQLFGIEILLRVTAAIEMVIMLTGMTAGALMNPALSWAALPGSLLYAGFNLAIAVGLRDLLTRLFARKRIREMVFFLLVLSAAMPQLLMARRGMLSPQLRLLIVGDLWPGWPWMAAANLILGRSLALSFVVLLAWLGAALAFSRWQFGRSLAFDTDAASAKARSGVGWMEGFYRLPTLLLRDPIGALIEKELRFLVRSARFRLVFLMGFTFGLVVWLPMVFVPHGPLGSFFVQNYLTVVCVYSLMLMSEVCFWNAFGFDRSAAQFYFAAPLRFKQVITGKNLTALFFLALEIAMITLVCALLHMPLGARRLGEVYGVTAVVTIFLFCAGNLMSIHHAHSVNPGNSFRTGAAGRLQAMLFIVYPVAFAPVALAYLARYAFKSQAALYFVLALDAILGLAFYRIARDSTIEAAENMKETMLAALSRGDGVISG
jgi:ABC-2 type transport system permease protein